MQTVQMYETHKTDDDFLLGEETEKKFLNRRSCKAIGLPFYDLNSGEFIVLSQDKIEWMRGHRVPSKSKIPSVIPVDPHRIGWLLWHKKYLKIVQSSFIALPTGKGIHWMMSKLKKPIPVHVSLITYVTNLIRLSELKGYSVFIVGNSSKACEKLFFNLKHAFPKLNIVGRHHITKDATRAEMITQGIAKLNPHIILVGIGYKDGLDWISKNRFKNSLIVNMADQIESLVGLRKKPPSFFGEKHLDWLWSMISNPLHWHRISYVIFWYFRIWLERFLSFFR